MPDHVPRGIVEIAQRLGFSRELLHAIFSEQCHPCFVGLANGSRREGLGYRHERDFIRITASPPYRGSDALANPLNIFGDAHKNADLRSQIATPKPHSAIRLLKSAI